MAKMRSRQNERDLLQFGENLAQWRKMLGLTAELTAERAGITRATLRSIERGEGAARLENVFMVLRVLNQSEGVLQATDPMNSDIGRLWAERRIPARVRQTRVADR